MLLAAAAAAAATAGQADSASQRATARLAGYPGAVQLTPDAPIFSVESFASPSEVAALLKMSAAAGWQESCPGFAESYEGRKVKFLSPHDAAVQPIVAKIANLWGEKASIGVLPLLHTAAGAPARAVHSDRFPDGTTPDAVLLLYLSDSDGADTTTFPAAGNLSVAPRAGRLLGFADGPSAAHGVGPTGASERFALNVPLKFGYAPSHDSSCRRSERRKLVSW